MDFLTGAAACENGKGILAFPSRTHRGVPRIVPLLKEGAGVVTTRQSQGIWAWEMIYI